MILLCGIPSEPPLEMVAAELERLDQRVAFLNQRAIGQIGMQFQIRAGRVTGLLRLGAVEYALESFDGVYTRLMDDRLLPELSGESEGSLLRAHSRKVHDALVRWCEIAPARVVNRAEPMSSNSSKPYQAQLIAAMGFMVPDTLVTNDPQAVRAFVDDHQKVVYKSISGARSIVRVLDEGELSRLDEIGSCPVQFQKFVPGTDLRVHVVGERVFATKILSGATDYRYAHRDNESVILEPATINGELAERCVALAATLGLSFAGIDLRLTPDEQIYCFEANPSPAFSYYEKITGQPIARAVADFLAGRSN